MVRTFILDCVAVVSLHISYSPLEVQGYLVTENEMFMGLMIILKGILKSLMVHTFILSVWAIE